MTTSPSPAAPPRHEERRRFGLSWIQIAAAGFASITATVILSFFSISGTLIGAAVFSMASAVGNAVYGQSLSKSRDVVLDVVPFGKADPASPTVVLPVTEEAVEELGQSGELTPALPAAESGTLSRRAWQRVAIFAVAIFAFVMAVVTGVELIAGRPLTDVLRGEKGSGTSLTGGSGSGGGVSGPTMTVTVTPSVTYTTPTVTQTAPAVTRTSTPTTTPSTPSGTPTSAQPSTPASSATSGTSSPASTTPSSTRTSGR